jgi:hypothetical protein
MKKQLKVLAAAEGLSLAATQAQATLVNGSDQTQGSTLFLAVWNSTTSYVRDLGITMGTVLNSPGNINAATAPNAAWVSNAGANFTSSTFAQFAGDSLFTSTFGSGGLAGLSWAIFAGDGAGVATSATNPGGFVATYGAGPASPPTTSLNNFTQVNNAGTRGGSSYINALNATANNNGGCAYTSTNFSCTQGSSSLAYAGSATAFGPRVATSLPSSDSVSTVASGSASSMPFWYLRTNVGNTITPASEFQFANSSNVGMFNLDSLGDVSYTLAAAASAVPIPGALWLFGSGLLGLIGISRRKPTPTLA